jgi:general nucleoside transport system permease protein
VTEPPDEPLEPLEGETLAGEDPVDEEATTAPARMAGYLRGGGFIVPLVTVLIAFVIAGLVVLVTGHDPFTTYWSIFKGSGLVILIPGVDHTGAADNLQQTLIVTTPLMLTGLAVAFGFRAGLFNIGGQGQYLVGSIAAVWVGSSFHSMPAVPHIVLAIAAGCVGGAIWAGIAGLLKATVGANEVISTIMLNWIAIWVGVWLFGLGGPLQSHAQGGSVPVSNDVTSTAKLPVFWGDPTLQGLHIGLFIALVALLVFWALINRSTAGYEVRAVGFNPEAARYSGMNVGRNYIRVMAICGIFAGLAGAIDVLGWQFRINTNDILASGIGFLGIAVALLGRNTAGGTAAAALLFGALVTGTSSRNLDLPDPSLTSNLTLLIQGLVVLFVSTDVIALTVLGRRRRGRRPKRRRGPPEPAPVESAAQERAA